MLLKPDKTLPTPLEEEIAATLVDLQSHDDMSESVKMLYFCGAKAIVIYVPVPQLRIYHQLHNRLVGELEKKLRGPQEV
ncbi:40S ribosomal protein S7 [Taenia crassiceps]|uniref:Small ribosomal subunit protein eS7 n=1 Tax=Taenia crassiceps TaxID=6207 RepID=A0ABR4QS67_9CEST